MNSIAEDIKDILVEEGIGTFGGSSPWSIFIGEEPATPSQCITIYDTGGEKPDYYYDPSHPPTQNKSFQVRVRGRTYNETYVKLDTDINNELENRGRFDVESEDGDTCHYTNIFKRSDVAYVGRGENNEYIFTCNYFVKREKRIVSP